MKLNILLGEMRTTEGKKKLILLRGTPTDVQYFISKSRSRGNSFEILTEVEREFYGDQESESRVWDRLFDAVTIDGGTHLAFCTRQHRKWVMDSGKLWLTNNESRLCIFSEVDPRMMVLLPDGELEGSGKEGDSTPQIILP